MAFENEPLISINAHLLDLNVEGLGPGEHGRAMVTGYLARISEIRAPMFTPKAPPRPGADHG